MRFYVTTSIPYVNGAPHIGHALEFVQADVLARFHRAKGNEVRFLSGTDENALKNVQAAEAHGVTVQDWVNTHAQLFEGLLHSLSISNDDFIRTASDPRHKKGADALWRSSKKEDIYKKKYRGLYCLGCEEFKMPGELVHGECVEHPGKQLEEVEEENYFFQLSSYQHQLEQLISTDTLRIVPETRKHETLAFIRSGLQDFSISRSRARAKGWGIPVPGDPEQIMYVWFDALSNYINALGYPNEGELYTTFWSGADEIIHVIGKGINRFHTVYWPAMLLSAGVPLPKTVFIHGYLTVDGQKISKTLGNVIDPQEVVKRYGVDATRYYLLREIPSYEDGDFSYEKFKERYEADLQKGLGNFAARVLTLGEKEGEISVDLTSKTRDAIFNMEKEVSAHVLAFRFHDALKSIWDLIGFGDRLVNDAKPWETRDKKVIGELIGILDAVRKELIPFLPTVADELLKRIVWRGKDLVTVKKGEVLFPRLG